MPALVAVRHDRHIQAFYDQRIPRAKSPSKPSPDAQTAARGPMTRTSGEKSIARIKRLPRPEVRAGVIGRTGAGDYGHGLETFTETWSKWIYRGGRPRSRGPRRSRRAHRCYADYAKCSPTRIWI